MQSIPLLAEASSAFLVGWWMAVLYFLPFPFWAWIISERLDKDAKYFHLNVRGWNAVHMGCGFAALLAMLLIPVPGAGFAVGLILLATPIMVYVKLRNKDCPDNQRFHLFSGQKIGERMAAKKAARAARAAAIQYVDSDGRTRDVPGKDDPRLATHMLSEDLLGPSLESRATRVELAVGPNGCAVSQTIDGMRYKREPIPADAAVAVIDYLKDVAGLDVEDRRRKQVGHFTMAMPEAKIEVHLTTAGSSNGQLMRLDYNRSQRLSRPFDTLGLLPKQMDALNTIVERHARHGVVLVGAPPGQGVTTTGYAFLNRHDAYTANIKTLEREVQVHLDGVDHQQWDPSNPDVDFATALQSILRRDPDLVLCEGIKDPETAVVLTEPGMTGPLIYVTQPLSSIPEQIREWVRLVGDVKQAAKVLTAVTNQRLMRSLCPNCRQPYTPTPEQLKKLNLPAERAKQLFRSSGKVQVKNKIENCPVCNGTGYLNQTAAFEVFMVDDEARRALSAGDLKKALSHARRNKMIYLQEAALSKVLQGETTIEEVIRATSPPKPEKPRPAAAAAG